MNKSMLGLSNHAYQRLEERFELIASNMFILALNDSNRYKTINVDKTGSETRELIWNGQSILYIVNNDTIVTFLPNGLVMKQSLFGEKYDMYMSAANDKTLVLEGLKTKIKKNKIRINLLLNEISLCRDNQKELHIGYNERLRLQKIKYVTKRKDYEKHRFDKPLFKGILYYIKDRKQYMKQNER